MLRLTLCVLVIAHATLAVKVHSLNDPTQKVDPLLPETKEFLKKLEKAANLEDIRRLEDEDDTFQLHDLGKNGPTEDSALKRGEATTSACKATSNEDAKTSSENGNTETSTEKEAKLGRDRTETSSPLTDKVTSETDNDNLRQGEATTETASNFANMEDRSVEDEDDTFELVDFGKSNGPTEESTTTMETASDAEQSASGERRTLAAAIERQLQAPPSESPTGAAKDSKKQRKKKRASEEPPPPTKEELEDTYKYEILPPPDNSPVKLDFPATPHAQGEEHLSKHVPLMLYCDTCMAIAYQLHLSFKKFHSQVTKRPPTESEIYHLVGRACRRDRFQEYGMLEVHGHRHISGPGCNQLEAEGGVKHSRGPWPLRLAERCEEVTEDIGELTLHSAWLREAREPERFKAFMCFGEAPRNYCEKYGHMDAAAEAAARLRSKPPEDNEEPVEAASRLAREAAENEERRLEELKAEQTAADTANDEL